MMQIHGSLVIILDHGSPEQRLDQKVTEAYQSLDALSSIGIDLDAVTQQLEDEGVEKFITAFDQLMASLKAFETRPSLSQQSLTRG